MLQAVLPTSLSESATLDGSSLHDRVAQAYALCDPAFAQDWLSRSGLDVTEVARKACLSVSQVRQLLQGSDASFYSIAIKRRAYQRVLALLGAPEPEPTALATASAPLGRMPVNETVAASLPELTVHQSLQPEQTVSMTVDKARRRVATYTAWAWLGLTLLLAAVTAEMWHGWLSTQVVAWRPAPVVPAPEPAAPSTPIADEPTPTETASSDASVSLTQPVSPIPTPPTSALAVSSGAVGAPVCAPVAQPATTVMPAVAQKAGNYVYVQARADVSLCVIDGEQRITQLQMKSGEGRSVYGAPPWQISGADLTRLNIYFQGWRVMLPEMATQQVALVERSR